MNVLRIGDALEKLRRRSERGSQHAFSGSAVGLDGGTAFCYDRVGLRPGGSIPLSRGRFLGNDPTGLSLCVGCAPCPNRLWWTERWFRDRCGPRAPGIAHPGPVALSPCYDERRFASKCEERHQTHGKRSGRLTAPYADHGRSGVHRVQPRRRRGRQGATGHHLR